MHRLLQTTSVEPRGTRVASDEDIGAVPRQRDHRVILQRRRVVAQRPVARDQQIHPCVEQVPRITARRKLEDEGVTVGSVRADLLRRRRGAGGPIRSRADRPTRVGRRLRDRQAGVAQQRRNVVPLLREAECHDALIGRAEGIADTALPEHDVLGRDRRAVPELGAAAQVERPATAAVVLCPFVRELGEHVAFAVDPHRCLVQVPEHNPLGVVAREGGMARVDRLVESDRDCGGPSGDGAGREQAALVGRLARLSSAGACDANTRVRARGKEGQRNDQC